MCRPNLAKFSHACARPSITQFVGLTTLLVQASEALYRRCREIGRACLSHLVDTGYPSPRITALSRGFHQLFGISFREC